MLQIKYSSSLSYPKYVEFKSVQCQFISLIFSITWLLHKLDKEFNIIQS